MAQVVVIPADPSEPVAIKQVNDYKDGQAIVGGLITLVGFGYEEDGASLGLMANDEGLLIGLPRNARASNIADKGQGYPVGSHNLVGDCYLTRADPEGETVDVTDNDMKRFNLF